MESNELGWKEVETLRSGVSTFLDTADWSDPKTTGNEAIVPADVAGNTAGGTSGADRGCCVHEF